MSSNFQWKKLRHYVYAYVDPRDNSIFYIGKGTGSRALAHMSDQSESEKSAKIAELVKLGCEPRIEFLRFGIETDAEAKRIEASCIDTVGVDKLTNIIKGKGSNSSGRKTMDEVSAIVSAEDAYIEEPALLIRVPQTFFYGIDELTLYEITRGTWNRLPAGYENARLAMPIYDGIIQEVYEIAGWFKSYSTQYFTRDFVPTDDGRQEFVGRIADAGHRKKYKYKSIVNTTQRSYGGSITPLNLAMI